MSSTTPNIVPDFDMTALHYRNLSSFRISKSVSCLILVESTHVRLSSLRRLVTDTKWTSMKAEWLAPLLQAYMIHDFSSLEAHCVLEVQYREIAMQWRIMTCAKGGITIKLLASCFGRRPYQAPETHSKVPVVNTFFVWKSQMPLSTLVWCVESSTRGVFARALR